MATRKKAAEKSVAAKAFTETVRAVAVVTVNDDVAFGGDAEQRVESFRSCDSLLERIEAKDGYIYGVGSCGNEVAVCHATFLPELIAILQRIVDAK
jgi:hypothetical protein